MECSAVATKPHAVCIPLPFQGHINCMLIFAKLLYARGFRITFVNTEFNHQKVLKSRGPDSLQGLPDFQFETIPDGLPPCDINYAQDIVALCDSLKVNILGPFRNLITKLNKRSVSSDTPSPRVSCIISDGVLTSPIVVAQEFGIPGVLLWPMSAAFLMTNLHCQQLVEKELIPRKDKEDKRNGYLNMHVDLIPGLRGIRIKDLPTYFLDVDDPLNFIVNDQLRRVSEASGIIINTFDSLESEVLEAMKSLLPPIYTIGPLHLLLQEISSNQLDFLGSNLWREEQDCLKWLNSKQPNSVVYVNFGSLVVLSSEQLIEFAWGLANSKQPFLWVIRPDLVIGEAAILPPEFTEETAGRSMVSGWCPQEQVLCHSSTGGFLTHSGWNSTMETMGSGVPVISWPFIGDQPMNRRYACTQWGIGMEIDEDVKREQVEGLVREMMQGEQGREMKKRAMEWKKNAEESTKPGGSSYLNLDKMVKEVLMKTKSI